MFNKLIFFSNAAPQALSSPLPLSPRSFRSFLWQPAARTFLLCCCHPEPLAEIPPIPVRAVISGSDPDPLARLCAEPRDLPATARPSPAPGPRVLATVVTVDRLLTPAHEASRAAAAVAAAALLSSFQSVNLLCFLQKKGNTANCNLLCFLQKKGNTAN